jgi:hypothetical protein
MSGFAGRVGQGLEALPKFKEKRVGQGLEALPNF